jgi:hypothetical protein
MVSLSLLSVLAFVCTVVLKFNEVVEMPGTTMLCCVACVWCLLSSYAGCHGNVELLQTRHLRTRIRRLVTLLLMACTRSCGPSPRLGFTVPLGGAK